MTRLEELVAAAIAALGDRKDPPACCRHVALEGAERAMCLEHPALGVRCRACLGDHVARHEWACAFCGARGVELAPVFLPHVVEHGALEHPKGAVAIYSGVVELVAHACRGCARQIGAA